MARSSVGTNSDIYKQKIIHGILFQLPKNTLTVAFLGPPVQISQPLSAFVHIAAFSYKPVSKNVNQSKM